MKSIRKTYLWSQAQANATKANYFGLSRNALDELAQDPLSNRSVLQWQEHISDQTLDRIPLFRVAEALLLILHEQGHIKMTPLGKLPRKVVLAVHQQGFVADPDIIKDPNKIWREEDCLYLYAARHALQFSPLVTVKQGKMRLTRTGQKHLEDGNRLALFKQFFTAFTQKYNWACSDGYTEHPVAQLGWGYTVYLLLQFMDSVRPIDFYGICYLIALPHTQYLIKPSYYQSLERNYLNAYALRTVHRFLVWFGLCLVSQESSIAPREDDSMVASEMLPELFFIRQ